MTGRGKASEDSTEAAAKTSESIDLILEMTTSMPTTALMTGTGETGILVATMATATGKTTEKETTTDLEGLTPEKRDAPTIEEKTLGETATTIAEGMTTPIEGTNPNLTARRSAE